MMTPVRKSIAISPVEFYGNALPRPRFNSHRLDPLLSCARDAQWSTSLRLQGRIEGDVDRLRAQQLESSSPGDSVEKKNCDSPPPAAAPVAVKRRRYFDLNGDGGAARVIRNLSDDFDTVGGGGSKIIKKSIESAAGKRLEVEKKRKKSLNVEETSSIRITSPRLTKSLCFR